MHTDKSAAVAHYQGLAAHADTQSQLSQYTGSCLDPQPGCELFRTTWGDAETIIEVEITPADGDGFNDPRTPESYVVLGALLNGRMCDADDVASDAQIERWLEAFAEHKAEQREGDAADADDAARDRARDLRDEVAA